MRALYVSHPQVQMNANVPVPLWGLSAEGRRRAEAFAVSGVVPKGAMIFSSRERKALELAELLAAQAGTLVLSDHLMGENDRSSTGFLPPELFEAHADRFFAEPEVSVAGWERAVDAQRRIVGTVATALASVPRGVPAIFCGHGAVGSLLKCHVAGREISRVEDQTRTGGTGGGNCFVFDLRGGVLHSEWTRLEDFQPEWFAPVATADVLL
ncbi:Broad specificity phosphatase PhoE [Devosia sp. YR412]|uniref:histidine phosphatase family protein n=1 Tax=Devosia sp. YR412 TaxID=1881030 RepID=UPI0008D82201|nr:histidine phosphatase family protein [Devosia sp. YR412]SEQ22412.1 Broad specificity phosphatase PhoE [Devosia sp. YR412]